MLSERRTRDRPMLGRRRSSNSRLSRSSYLVLGICGCACLSRLVPTPGGLRRSIRGRDAERLGLIHGSEMSIACSFKTLLTCSAIVSTSVPGFSAIAPEWTARHFPAQSGSRN
jgi:hypothetical protein